MRRLKSMVEVEKSYSEVKVCSKCGEKNPVENKICSECKNIL